MGFLPKRMSAEQKRRANKTLKKLMTPRQEIALDLAINGPLKKNKKFVFRKSGPKRVKK